MESKNHFSGNRLSFNTVPERMRRVVWEQFQIYQKGAYI
jgi:hypothetical protein